MKAEVVELPLFPLDVVLFPGQTLPLHIFEPRYRTMVQRCIDDDRPFGIILAEDDDAPHVVGTAARITQVERLPDGRLNIMTVGTERFTLQDVHLSDDDYLVGDVVAFPFKNDIDPASRLIPALESRLRRYLKLATQVHGFETSTTTRRFPEDPMALAVFAAIALQLPLDDKQELLSVESVTDLLALELDVIEDELFTLTMMATAVRPPESESSAIFSVN